MTTIQDAGMADIIPIRENGEAYWVDARHLHLALGTGTRFNDWVTRRLAETVATEGEDFYSELSKTTGGRPSTEYRLTVDLAKEFAMLERTTRGKAVRRYFIEAEKHLRDGTKMPIRQEVTLTPAQQALMAAQALVNLEERTQVLELEVSSVRQELDRSPIQGADLRQVFDLGQRLGQLMGDYRKAWRLFKDRFQLASYRDLPRNQLDDAVHFLQAQIGAWQGAPLLGSERA